ncbi:MAG: hypothetical protein JOZ96_27585 [Acidobacteria bacterium]|nr:hypothetical protein [Acidobacteriota bacterium]
MSKKAQRYLNRLGLHLERARQRLRRSGFSNFDEERMLAGFVARLVREEAARVAVDVGAGDGIRGSNTYALFLQGWRGVGFEGDEKRARRLARAYKSLEGVGARHALVNPDNVVSLLRAEGVPRDFGVLSLDIDSYDYWVLDAVLKKYRPRVVVTELNEKIPPPVLFRVRFDPEFRLQHHFFGYSIASLEELCARHDYALLALEYNNAFIAPRELVGDLPVLDAETAYRRGYLERSDRRERFPRNHDMEALHALTPADSVAFIKNFFARHEGKYEVGLAETPEPAEAVHS